MSDTIFVALISAGGSVLVAVIALILNYRGFSAIDSRFASLDNRFASIDNRFASIERRLERLEEDHKQFFQWMGRIETEIARIKEHIGLKS